jgi:serine/threonine protein kinase
MKEVFMPALINVAPSEWEEAKNFFKANPDEIKFQKKITTGGKEQGHSFIKIAGEIWALNNTQHTTIYEPDAGLGAFSRGKMALNENNKVIFIKIEAKEDKQDLENESTQEIESIMKEANYLLGREKRVVKPGESGTITVKLGDHVVEKTTTEKWYTAYEYRGDRELYSELFERGALSPAQIRVLALRAMMGIEALHRLNILHRDIKPENLMVNGEGVTLVVMPIDFDLAEKLEQGEDHHIWTHPNGEPALFGTAEYIAPESREQGKYSFASDVYGLGVMLNYMNLPIAKQMMAPEAQRIKLPQAMKAVADYMKNNFKTDPQVQKTLADYERFIGAKPHEALTSKSTEVRFSSLPSKSEANLKINKENIQPEVGVNPKDMPKP